MPSKSGKVKEDDTVSSGSSNDLAGTSASDTDSPVLVAVPSMKASKSTASVTLTPDDGMYYYYQSADGQYLFLHPLDIKMLKVRYQTYANFPDELCVRIRNVVDTTLTDEVRNGWITGKH